jgi:hypothetical protein
MLGAEFGGLKISRVGGYSTPGHHQIKWLSQE